MPTRFDSRLLTAAQTLHVNGIKNCAELLATLIDGYCDSPRERACAVTHLEECVMYAVRSISLGSPKVTDTLKSLGAAQCNAPLTTGYAVPVPFPTNG